MKAAAQNGFVLRDVSHKFQADPAVVLAAVTKTGGALRYASPTLQDDRDVVLAAVDQNGLVLQDVSPLLQADRDVVLAAVAQDGRALRYAPTPLRSDRAVVLAALAKNDMALEYVSPALLKAHRGRRVAKKFDELLRAQDLADKPPVWQDASRASPSRRAPQANSRKTRSRSRSPPILGRL